jgi:2-polyprenyl-3-methyl-5-hydroxy-6-metoxy-1,4-benzoquinol methylase
MVRCLESLWDYDESVDMHAYWERVYKTHAADQVGWYEADPVMSRRFIGEAIAGGARSVIDIGGGASALVDHLLDLDLERVAVLDVSETGLALAKQRLADRATTVEWIAEDVTQLGSVGTFDVWHDRAVFHFLTSPMDRDRYVRVAERTVRPGGTAIMATFAPDAPDHCSGLEVCRYDAWQLAEECGPKFELLEAQQYVHMTPSGRPQSFVYSRFRRAARVASRSALLL